MYTRPTPHVPRRRLAAAALMSTALLLAGCGSSSSSSAPDSSGGSSAPAVSASGKPESTTLRVATHDSWAMDKKVLADFTAQTGVTVKIVPQGDAGELTNRLVLTKDSPLADMTYGIDNTFASRAVEGGVLQDYRPSEGPASLSRFALSGKGADRLTPVDYGDVCVNVDDAWFARSDKTPPASLEDLLKPEYKNLFVTPAPTTSSPGLAFLLSTVDAFGEDGWVDYWTRLLANGAKVTAGWSDAYEVDFTAGGGSGKRPIVLSYSSSPPFTIPEGGTKPTTSALLDTCYRQVEYAGVLAGSKNPTGAAQLIDFMVGREFQKALPDNMYVYPADTTVALPPSWKTYAPVATKPFSVSPATITEKRSAWLSRWRDLASR